MMTKKKIIIGKNGFIATQLLQKEKKLLCTSSNPNEDADFFLDLKYPEQFDYDASIDTNTVIILLAAISSPDQCNNHYDDAYAVNVTGTKYFIEEVIKRGGKVLFFSSDVVYGNTLTCMDEDAPINPFGQYAHMKAEIEALFQKESNFKVFRLSYVLSSEDKYLAYLKHCIQNEETAEVFHPFGRKVIALDDVIDAIIKIVDHWDNYPMQKVNLCGECTATRKDIADIYNLLTGNRLQYRLIEPDDAFWEARPKDINIVSKYLTTVLGRKPMSIIDAVKKSINQGV